MHFFENMGKNIYKEKSTYKKEILEARKTGNIEILYDAVGKENLEESRRKADV